MWDSYEDDFDDFFEDKDDLVEFVSRYGEPSDYFYEYFLDEEKSPETTVSKPDALPAGAICPSCTRSSMVDCNRYCNTHSKRYCSCECSPGEEAEFNITILGFCKDCAKPDCQFCVPCDTGKCACNCLKQCPDCKSSVHICEDCKKCMECEHCTCCSKCGATEDECSECPKCEEAGCECFCCGDCEETEDNCTCNDCGDCGEDLDGDCKCNTCTKCEDDIDDCECARCDNCGELEGTCRCGMCEECDKKYDECSDCYDCKCLCPEQCRYDVDLNGPLGDGKPMKIIPTTDSCGHCNGTELQPAGSRHNNMSLLKTTTENVFAAICSYCSRIWISDKKGWRLAEVAEDTTNMTYLQKNLQPILAGLALGGAAVQFAPAIKQYAPLLKQLLPSDFGMLLENPMVAGLIGMDQSKPQAQPVALPAAKPGEVPVTAQQAGQPEVTERQVVQGPPGLDPNMLISLLAGLSAEPKKGQ